MENETVENAPAESVTATKVSESSSSSEVDKDKASNSGGSGGGGEQEEGSSAEGTGTGGGVSSLLGGVAVALERTDSVSSDCRTPTAKDKDPGKINILLKPVGDAPILKQKLWAVPQERLVSQITEFVKKYLKLEKNQNLFIFVNQLFAPAPDQCVRDLYECFGSDRKLVLHYSTTIAWG